MALTDAEEARIQRIEEQLANHTKAINNLASKRQLQHASGLFQTELEEIRSSLTSLQSQLDAIKG